MGPPAGGGQIRAIHRMATRRCPAATVPDNRVGILYPCGPGPNGVGRYWRPDRSLRALWADPLADARGRDVVPTVDAVIGSSWPESLKPIGRSCVERFTTVALSRCASLGLIHGRSKPSERHYSCPMTARERSFRRTVVARLSPRAPGANSTEGVCKMQSPYFAALARKKVLDKTGQYRILTYRWRLYFFDARKELRAEYRD